MPGLSRKNAPRFRTSRKAARAALAILCCLLLAAAFVTPSAHAQTYPDRSACDTSWYDSSKSSFSLSSAQELAGLAYLVTEEHVTFEGKTVALDSDIDLSSVCGGEVSWRPIGWGYSTGTPFEGTFDGKGHTVSNLHIDDSGHYNALFGSVRSAVIKNLTVSGEVYGSEYAAGIISQCADSSLMNLTNEVDVDTLKYNAGTAHEGRAAGVVCYVATAYPTGDMTFSRLVNKGNIKSTSYYTAGVIGFLYNSTGFTTTVTECANEGDVDVSDARYGLDGVGKAAGGVIGSTAGDYGTYKVSSCYNTGNIIGANLKSAGGVAGYLGGVGSSLSDCYNAGSVSGDNNAGGVVGYFGSTGGELAGSYNAGAVSGSKTAGVVAKASNSGQSYARNFTLDTAASKAYGSNVAASNDGAVKTRKELRLQSFLDYLNSGTTNFSIDNTKNNGLPVLTWQGVPVAGGGGEVEDTPQEDPDPDDPSGGEDLSGADDQTDHAGQDGQGSGIANENPDDYVDVSVEDPAGSSDPETNAEQGSAAVVAAAGKDSSAGGSGKAAKAQSGAKQDAAASKDSGEAAKNTSKPEKSKKKEKKPAISESEEKAAGEDERQLVELASVSFKNSAIEEHVAQIWYVASAVAAALCILAGFIYESRKFARSRAAYISAGVERS